MSKKANFFIVGEPKCGTTILYNYLKKHDNIVMSNKKEPHFFAKDFQKESDKIGSQAYRYRDIKDYHKLFHFSKSSKYYGEASTGYLYSKKAAENIYNYNSNAKIIAFFRDPISFLKSYHNYIYTQTYEDIKDFQQAWKYEDIRKKNKYNQSFFSKGINYPSNVFYSKWIKYTKQLKRYLDVFPQEQIKVFIYEEFKKDNQKVVNEICDFLDIEKMNIERKKANVSKGVRFYGLRSILTKSMKTRKIAQKILPYGMRKKWGDFVQWLTLKEQKKKEKIDPKFKKELKKKFKPEVQKFNKLLHEKNLIDKDMDLVKYWGYDKI